MKQYVKNREKLERFEGKVVSCIADFICFGKTTLSEGVPQETVLLKNLRLEKGENISTHVWIHKNEIKNFYEFKLKKNKKIHFTGIPYSYFCEMRGKIVKKKMSLGNVKITAINDI